MLIWWRFLERPVTSIFDECRHSCQRLAQAQCSLNPFAATPRWAEELLQHPETVRPAAPPALTVPAALEGALQAAVGAPLGAELTLVKGGGTPGRPGQRSMIALQLLPQGGSGDWQICAPLHSVLWEDC